MKDQLIPLMLNYYLFFIHLPIHSLTHYLSSSFFLSVTRILSFSLELAYQQRQCHIEGYIPRKWVEVVKGKDLFVAITVGNNNSMCLNIGWSQYNTQMKITI